MIACEKLSATAGHPVPHTCYGEYRPDESTSAVPNTLKQPSNSVNKHLKIYFREYFYAGYRSSISGHDKIV